jgi:tRNA nucleotidyltransferase/poly(A) polymerase
MGLVGDLSGARVRDELVAILSEAEVSGSLVRLDELGLAGAVHPALDCGPAAVALVGRVDDVRARRTPALPAWRLRLAVLAAAIPADELESWLERLRVRRRDARVVAAATVIAPRLREPLEAAAEPAQIAELLASQADEVAVMIAAGESPAADAAELYLTSLRQVRLDIDGGTLREELGMSESPLVGELLAELLRRRRNGQLGSREQQIAAARDLLAEVTR